MPTAAILSLATGLPNHRHQQMALLEQCTPYINSHRAKAVYAAAEIETRYSVLASTDFFAGRPGTQARNQLYLAAARPLAADTIRRALAAANLTAADIDHFIVVSCTGFDTPGLEVRLAGDLGMRSDLRRSALIGMGCQAGLTGLDRALLELAARPDSRVLVLAVELCTLHFQPGSKLDDLVAGALFGDGLAAAVVGAAPAQADRLPRLLETMSFNDYEGQELMGFHLSDTGYQIHLATRVPKILGRIVPELVPQFLSRAGLNLGDIRFWGIHPGGAKILDYVGEALQLKPEQLRFSRHVLRHYGNLSSATIFFVLNEIIQQGQPQAGDYGLLLTFGPGMTIELCLAQW